jgi:hypothetical protein
VKESQVDIEGHAKRPKGIRHREPGFAQLRNGHVEGMVMKKKSNNYQWSINAWN